MGSGLTVIEDSTFANCSRLQRVVIGTNVHTISKGAFFSCRYLEEVVIPSSARVIAERAFKNCDHLQNLSLPNGVQEVRFGAFIACTSRQSLMLPSSLVGFDCTIDTTAVDWNTVCVADILSLVKSEEYAVRMDVVTKYSIAIQLFLQYQRSSAAAFVKKNCSKILTWMIDQNDYEGVKSLFECGQLISGRNIQKYLDYAIDHTQTHGDMQIQVYITNYKHTHFPDMNPFRSLRL